MATAVLEISGLYQKREEGERVACTLRDRGYSPVTVFPLTKDRIARMPADAREDQKRVAGAVLAPPLGFLALAIAVAVPVGLVGGPLFAAPAGLLAGIVGAVLGLLWSNQTPERYRKLEAGGGVVVTASCAPEVQEEVITAFHETQATEVEIITN